MSTSTHKPRASVASKYSLTGWALALFPPAAYALALSRHRLHENANSSDFVLHRSSDEHRVEGIPIMTYQAVDPPTLLRPLREPKLNARPCDRLRILTNPVIGPSSPSFSMLKFAKASSPVSLFSYAFMKGADDWISDLPKTLLAYKFALKN